jgi:isocitrate dehydrogenase (NAD+)
MDRESIIRKAQEEFAERLNSELDRIELMKQEAEPKDYSKLEKIVVGVMPGDGTGPVLMEHALRVANELVKDEVASGKIEFRTIEGMTIENRVAKMQSLPDEVLAACKECDVLVKGPFITPRAGDGLPNLVSANSLLRRELQLFAAVRPIRIPDKGIDWTFFRENIEGEYILGNRGIRVGDELAIDFKVCTKPGAERIARAAFDFARKNGKHNVTVVTKANIVKLVDGDFLQAVHRIGESEYPEIEIREELVDSMAAKLGSETFMQGIDVIVLPNLYGDIVTDVAAEMQGGLGTASSSNIGSRYALFEAIHGAGLRIMQSGRGPWANPGSLIRAMGEMLAHIGYGDRKTILDKAMDICTVTEKKLVITGRQDGCTGAEFTDYLIDTIRALRAE